MRKFLIYLVSIIFSLILFFVILFTATELVVYNLNYYKWHYLHRGIEAETGIEINDLMKTTKILLNYLKDKQSSLDFKTVINGEYKEVFGEREKTHMIDVKNLVVAAKKIRDYGAFSLIGMFIIIILLNKNLLIKTLSSVKYVFFFTIGMLFLLSILMIIDFNKYFTIFHKIFFNNDLWLLDPQTDILINMVPEIFFFTTAMLIIILFLILSVIIIFCLELFKKKLIMKIR